MRVIHVCGDSESPILIIFAHPDVTAAREAKDRAQETRGATSIAAVHSAERVSQRCRRSQRQAPQGRPRLHQRRTAAAHKRLAESVARVSHFMFSKECNDRQRPNQHSGRVRSVPERPSNTFILTCLAVGLPHCLSLGLLSSALRLSWLIILFKLQYGFAS